MFGLFHIVLVGALLLLTDIETTDSAASPGDWKRDTLRDINVYINGDAYPTAAESPKVTPKRDAGTTFVNGKFTVQLIFRIDPLERQASLPVTINGGEFGRAARQNTKYCVDEHCNYSSEFEIVDPTATPAFIELQKINRNQRRRTADGVGEEPKRVTVLPHRSKPSVNQMLTSISTSSTTVRDPFPITPDMHLVDGSQIANDEWARRTQARTPNVRTTTARYPVSVDSNTEGFLMEQRNRRTTEKSRTEVNRRKTWTLSDTDILFQEKTKETDFYGNRKRQITGEGSTAIFSDKDGDGIQSPEFNQPIFRTPGKLLTVIPVDVPSQATDTTPVTEHSDGGTSNPGQHDSSTPVPDKMQVNQTTDDWTVPEHPSPPVPCEELDCLPWERRDKFEVQVNPRTKEVVNIRVHTIAANNKPVIKPSEEYKDSRSTETPLPPSNAIGKSATEATEVALERTITSTEHDELTWFDRQDHQVQIDPETGQVVNIRTQTKIPPNLRMHEHQVDSTTEAVVRQAVSTPRVTTQPTLPIPISLRKQISSQTENETTIHGRNVTKTDPFPIPEPSEEPKGLPWQQKDGFEVQINPVTKDIVNIRTRTVEKERSIPIVVPVEQPTLPDGVRKTPTLISETFWDSGEPLSTLDEDSHEVQTRENSERKDMANIETPLLSDGQITIDLVPTAERSTESTAFPWEPRDDYEVQIDPKTQQIVNIRLPTTTTGSPISKLEDDSMIVRSQTSGRIRTIDIGRIVKPDNVFVEPSGSVVDRNSKIRTQARTDDELPDAPRLRTAVITGSNQKKTAIRPPMNGRERTIKMRKRIFSHSDADGVLYFRFTDNDDLWEELEVQQFHDDAKFVVVDEDDWISTRRGRGRDSPYFYFSQGNSSSISFSCYIVLFVACLLSFISCRF